MQIISFAMKTLYRKFRLIIPVVLVAVFVFAESANSDVGSFVPAACSKLFKKKSPPHPFEGKLAADGTPLYVDPEILKAFERRGKVKLKSKPLPEYWRIRDRERRIKYFSKDEMLAHKVYIYEGSFYDSEGYLLERFDPKRDFMIVVDGTGNTYVEGIAEFNDLENRYHHSSYLAGGPAAFSGRGAFVHGKLVPLYNWSGHYKCDPTYMEQAIELWREQGADLSKLEVNVISAQDLKSEIDLDHKDITVE